MVHHSGVGDQKGRVLAVVPSLLVPHRLSQKDRAHGARCRGCVGLWQSFTGSATRLCFSSRRGGLLCIAGGFIVAFGPFVKLPFLFASSRLGTPWIRRRQCWTQVTRRLCHERRTRDLSEDPKGPWPHRDRAGIAMVTCGADDGSLSTRYS